MIVFDASTLILIAKGEFLDLFISHAGMPVVIPGEVEGSAVVPKKCWMRWSFKKPWVSRESKR